MADWGNMGTSGPAWNDNSGASAAQEWGPISPVADQQATADNDPFGANDPYGANETGPGDLGPDEGAFAFGDGPSSITCNECGKEGHIRRDCPDKPPMTCHGCGEEGHIRKECPNKPAQLCRNCCEEGHNVIDCVNPRKIDRSHVQDVDPEVAWDEMKEAVVERDIFDFKEALAKYLKTYPDMNYLAIEEWLRSQDLNIYVIAVEREVMPTMTLMDLQGNLGRKWCVQYCLSPKPDRPRDVDCWPQSAEENLKRLSDAGEPVPTGIPRCTNCKEMGHIAKNCEMEKTDERVSIRCFNCDAEGHRMRDCPNPRKDKFTCKNCNQPGHKAADCTEPRSAAGVECNKCHEMGHFSRDCPQNGGGGACRNCGQEGHFAKECTEPRQVQCRNCDEFGHMSRECPQPTNVAKIKCNNCGEMGHKKMHCPNPTVGDTDNFGGEPTDTLNNGGASGGWNYGAANDGGNGGCGTDWGAAAPAAAPAAGGSWGAGSAHADTGGNDPW